MFISWTIVDRFLRVWMGFLFFENQYSLGKDRNLDQILIVKLEGRSVSTIYRSISWAGSPSIPPVLYEVVGRFFYGNSTYKDSFYLF